MARLNLALLAAIFVVGGLLAGCAKSAEPAVELSMEPLHHMPADVQNAPVRVQEAYQFAVANADLLQTLPCYCGCSPLGHKNNYDCYVAGVDPAGVVEFDAHALGCQICVDITQDAMRFTREGRSLISLQQHVDRNYARYGPSNLVQ